MSDYFDFPVNGQIAIDISSSGDNNIISMQSYLSEKYPNSDLKDLNLRRTSLGPLPEKRDLLTLVRSRSSTVDVKLNSMFLLRSTA
jgi:hypothetical protein